MKKLTVVVAAIVLLLSMIVAMPVAAQSTATHVYPGDSIQAAVDAASQGEVIIVHAGVYHQSVVISTDGITLKGKHGAVLDGDGPPDDGTDLTAIGIWLSSGVTGVTITGFEIRDYVAFQSPYLPPYDIGIAIWLESGSHDNSIARNKIPNCTFGIGVSTSGNNLIERNKVFTVLSGIMLEQHSYDNRVIMNSVTDSTGGIGADEESHGNLIQKNKVSGCEYGIGLTGGSYDNEIIQNMVSDSSVCDLCWDSTGSGNTWEKNKYDTSDFQTD